ncbi:MAG: IS66 family insertion sequence element accessory protein TnpB [Cyanobacteria bacterium REEB65]|nr:IS66 family insertion sequence element accessory protein TnpB [Cyanobacteria bacterium REEB65]
MRKGFNGLFALARDALGKDVLDGDLFLFVGRTRQTAKVLLWDGTGLCVFAKRLEKSRFAAPWAQGQDGRWQLTVSELQPFLEGCSWVGKIPLSPPPFVI